MNAASTLCRARGQAGLSRRELARRAGTSNSTLADYEAGRKMPSVATLDRIVRAAGFELEVEMAPGVGDGHPGSRGRELIEALELAALFPARHAPNLEFPKFGHR
jgi:transcriptional regulator with XRE-family HTH domain